MRNEADGMKKEGAKAAGRAAQIKKELAALTDLLKAKSTMRDTPKIRAMPEAERTALYRPMKQQLTLRLDADVLAWFRDHTPKGYQTEINRALREHVERHEWEE